MKRLALACLLLVSALSWSQHDTTEFVIRTYGFQSYGDYEEVEDSIAKRWDLMFLPVAGCLVTDDFTDSIRQLNTSTHLRLKARYGDDWEERFDEEVNAAYTVLKQYKELTYKNTSECKTNDYSLQILQNLSFTGMKFLVIQTHPDYSKAESISIKGLQHTDPTIVYRGYENKIEVAFTIPRDTFMIRIKKPGGMAISDSCLTSSNITFKYRLSGSQRTDTLSIELPDGETVTQVFQVKNPGTPCIYLNDEFLDSTLSVQQLKNESLLSVKMEKGCLIPDKYNVVNWEISTSTGKRYLGTGAAIPPAITSELSKLKPGTEVRFELVISDDQNHKRKKSALVKRI